MKRYLPQAVTIVAVFLLAVLVARVSAKDEPGPDLTELIALIQAQGAEISELKAAMNKREEEPEPQETREQEAREPIVIHIHMPGAPEEPQVIEVEKVVEKEVPVYIEVEVPRIIEVPVYIEREPEEPDEPEEPEPPDEPEPPEEEPPEEEEQKEPEQPPEEEEPPEEEPEPFLPSQINYSLMPIKSNIGIFEYFFTGYILTATFYPAGAGPITHDFDLSALWTSGSLSPGPLPINPVQSAWVEGDVIYLNLLRFYVGEKPPAEQHTIDIE